MNKLINDFKTPVTYTEFETQLKSFGKEYDLALKYFLLINKQVLKCYY